MSRIFIFFYLYLTCTRFSTSLITDFFFFPLLRCHFLFHSFIYMYTYTSVRRSSLKLFFLPLRSTYVYVYERWPMWEEKETIQISIDVIRNFPSVFEKNGLGFFCLDLNHEKSIKIMYKIGYYLIIYYRNLILLRSVE